MASSYVVLNRSKCYPIADYLLNGSTMTQPKPFVFVLMPFDSRFADVYEFGIK